MSFLRNLGNSPPPSQPPQHSYLSAIRDLQAADAEENLKKKREQQIAFAESLRRQIEEKQQQKEQQQQQRKMAEPKQIHYTFGDDKNQKLVEQPMLYKGKSKSALDTYGNLQKYDSNNIVDFNFASVVNFDGLSGTASGSNKRKASPQQQPKKQPKIFTKADLSQFDHFAMVNKPPIQICTDSPFSNSTVPTPPQGFSMRPLPIVQAQQIPIGNNNINNIIKKETQQLFSDVQFENNNMMVNLPQIQGKQKQKQKIHNNKNIKEFIEGGQIPAVNEAPPQQRPAYRPPQVRAKSVLLKPPENFTKLGAESELIYPDGHMSPVISSRESAF